MLLVMRAFSDLYFMFKQRSLCVQAPTLTLQFSENGLSYRASMPSHARPRQR